MSLILQMSSYSKSSGFSSSARDEVFEPVFHQQAANCGGELTRRRRHRKQFASGFLQVLYVTRRPLALGHAIDVLVANNCTQSPA